jgi:hypothetical protein
MNETIPDKEAYQTNRRRMCWAALGMTIACTIATIYDPVRMSEADSILMAQYLALLGLVGTYFALGGKS